MRVMTSENSVLRMREQIVANSKLAFSRLFDSKQLFSINQ